MQEIRQCNIFKGKTYEADCLTPHTDLEPTLRIEKSSVLNEKRVNKKYKEYQENITWNRHGKTFLKELKLKRTEEMRHRNKNRHRIITGLHFGHMNKIERFNGILVEGNATNEPKELFMSRVNVKICITEGKQYMDNWRSKRIR